MYNFCLLIPFPLYFLFSSTFPLFSSLFLWPFLSMLLPLLLFIFLPYLPLLSHLFFNHIYTHTHTHTHTHIYIYIYTHTLTYALQYNNTFQTSRRSRATLYRIPFTGPTVFRYTYGIHPAVCQSVRYDLMIGQDY